IHLVQGEANLDDATGDPENPGSSQRLEYTDANGDSQQVATMNDGLSFGGDTGTDVDRKLGQKLNLVGGATGSTQLTFGNIGVVADGDSTLEIKLAQNIDLGDDGSVTMGNT